MIVLTFFILGLIIGSFLNVVVSRLQAGETLLGRSFCRSCRKQIHWYDNIPLISFLLLGGKCRQCKEKISWQYPLVELGTALVFLAVGKYVFALGDRATWLISFFYLGLFSVLIVIFVYDFLSMYIPMIMVWTGIAWVLMYFGISFLLNENDSSVLSDFLPLFLSGGGVFLFFWSLVKISDEQWMGMGDAYLGLLLGLATGWPGALWALTLSFGLGAIIGLFLIAFGKKGMKSQVPFAPFMTMGIGLALLLPEIFPGLRLWMTFG